MISEINNNLVLEIYDKLHYEDICITPFVTNNSITENESKIFEINYLINSSRVAIIGEPGSGKTTALRKLALDLLNKIPCNIIPIYISLASFGLDFQSKKFNNINDYINYEVSLFGCTSVENLKLDKNAEIILLLDGWDEILNDEAIALLKKFLSTTDYKFIVTSRPEAQRSLPFAERFEMHPLSIDRIQEFVKLRIKQPDQVLKLMKWLNRNPNILKLAENPLNLSILTIVFSEEGNIGKLTKTNLYERAFEAIIRQHHREHPYNGLFSSTEDQTLKIEKILQIIAFNVVINSEGRFFTIRQLNKATTEVMKKVPSGFSNLLSGRLGIIRDRRSGRMEFFHLWYQEFLTARHIVESKMDKIKLLNNKSLASVFAYTVGLIQDKQEALILMNEVTIHDPFNYCRAINEGNFNQNDIEMFLLRVISFGESHKPKIPVRVELARAIAQSGPIVQPVLFKIARNYNLKNYYRRTALEALAILSINKYDFENLLLELLSTKSLDLLWHVIEHVGNSKIKSAIIILEKLIKHKHPIVKGDAIWALAEIQENPIIEMNNIDIEKLLACLSSENRHVQGHALRTLGRLKIEKAIPKLRLHLEQNNSGYRWIAPEAAVLIGGEASIDLLEIALNDSDDRVVAATLKAISEIDHSIPLRMIEKIKQHMYNDNWVPYLEQPLGSIARSTYQKLLNMSKRKDFAELYIARHCKTSWNKERRLQGTTNIPLSNEGYIQAKNNIDHIKNIGFNRIISSISKRAYETAQIYSDTLKIPLHKHPGLRELDHGEWEGIKIDDLLTNSKWEYKEWLNDPSNIIIPGGKESVTTAQQRIVEAICNIALRYRGEKILIITHKHIKSLLLCSLLNLKLNKFKDMIDESIQVYKIDQTIINRLCQIRTKEKNENAG